MASSSEFVEQKEGAVKMMRWGDCVDLGLDWDGMGSPGRVFSWRRGHRAGVDMLEPLSCNFVFILRQP